MFSLSPSSTLGAHHDEWDVGCAAMCVQLAEELVDLLETGLILQAEHQDDRIHPATELSSEKTRDTDINTQIRSPTCTHTHTDMHTHTQTCTRLLGLQSGLTVPVHVAHGCTGLEIRVTISTDRKSVV